MVLNFTEYILLTNYRKIIRSCTPNIEGACRLLQWPVLFGSPRPKGWQVWGAGFEKYPRNNTFTLKFTLQIVETWEFLTTWGGKKNTWLKYSASLEYKATIKSWRCWISAIPVESCSKSSDQCPLGTATTWFHAALRNSVCPHFL